MSRKRAAGPIAYPLSFETFWTGITSPRTKGLKSEALAAWEKTGKPEGVVLIMKWGEYLRSLGDTFPKDVCRWLAKRGHLEEYKPARAAQPDTRCTFHKRPGCDGRPSSYPVKSCDRCRHFRARNGMRTGEPTDLSELARKGAELEAKAEQDRAAAAERFRQARERDEKPTARETGT